MPVEQEKRRKPKARNTQVIMGALEENTRMLLREPHSEGIGARIAELLDELARSINSKREEEPEG